MNMKCSVLYALLLPFAYCHLCKKLIAPGPLQKASLCQLESVQTTTDQQKQEARATCM
jgi:hypothetical protein